MLNIACFAGDLVSFANIVTSLVEDGVIFAEKQDGEVLVTNSKPSIAFHYLNLLEYERKYKCDMQKIVRVLHTDGYNGVINIYDTHTFPSTEKFVTAADVFRKGIINTSVLRLCSMPSLSFINYNFPLGGTSVFINSEAQVHPPNEAPCSNKVHFRNFLQSITRFAQKEIVYYPEVAGISDENERLQ